MDGEGRNRVAIEGCETYSEDEVYEALKSCLKSLGGMEAFVRPGMTVALKPNLLLPQNPESCATTHPAVVAAAGRLVKEAGGEPLVVESPGGPYTKFTLKNVYRACGLFDVCEKHGIGLNYDTSTVKKTVECIDRTRSFNMLKPLVEADFVINICKMKTHGMMVFTGAVKNMFGSIAGVEKAAYHMNMPDYEAFASNLIDICEASNPGLSIMDAVTAMEGKGPSAGKPKKVGAVLASPSPYALDMAAHDIIGLKRKESYVLDMAGRRGIETGYTETLKHAADFSCPDFDIPFKKGGLVHRGPLNNRLLLRFKSKPVVDRSMCKSCGICMKNCPAEVITLKDGYPVFDYSGCIRCFCCQELCPEHAIDIHDPFIIKILTAGRK